MVFSGCLCRLCCGGRQVLFIFLVVLPCFYVWQGKKWKERKINKRDYLPGQFRKEMIRSNLTSVLFGISGALLLLLWQKGYIRIYEDIRDYPLWWLPASLVIALVLQETYYYWLHRWMHIPVVFRLVHKWHHDSHIASPWTAFSFHPLEGLIQAVFLPLILLFLPNEPLCADHHADHYVGQQRDQPP